MKCFGETFFVSQAFISLLPIVPHAFLLEKFALLLDPHIERYIFPAEKILTLYLWNEAINYYYDYIYYNSRENSIIMLLNNKDKEKGIHG